MCETGRGKDTIILGVIVFTTYSNLYDEHYCVSMPTHYVPTSTDELCRHGIKEGGERK
jgi:hypothetical protein